MEKNVPYCAQMYLKKMEKFSCPPPLETEVVLGVFLRELAELLIVLH